MVGDAWQRFTTALVWVLMPLAHGSAAAQTAVRPFFTDDFASQAYTICQLIGSSDHAESQVVLSEIADPVIRSNRDAIVSALESLQGSLGRCSHVSRARGGVARMVFQFGYSVAFSWEAQEGLSGVDSSVRADQVSRKGGNVGVPQLKWHHFFAPHLEGIREERALERLRHEHPGSVFAFRAEAWLVADSAAQFAFEEGSDHALRPGSASRLVSVLGPQDQTMRIASVFKLSVLNELLLRIRSRNLSWADRPFESTGRSIEETAREMIVRSDNEATDQLLNFLGLSKLTRSKMLFRLKYSLPEFYRTIYPLAHAVMKKHIENFAGELEGGQSRMCALGRCNAPYLHSSLDWTATPGEVCAILREIDDRADDVALSILGEYEPFLEESRKQRFSYFGFKGGRDVGVLAAAYLLRGGTERLDSKLGPSGHHEEQVGYGLGDAGRPSERLRSCVVVVWNDSEEDVAYGKFSYLTNWFFDVAHSARQTH
jgi:hypothetical protein